MYKTESAKVTLIIVKHPLVILVMEYPNSSRNKKSIHLAFDKTKPYDMCQLLQLSNITGTAFGNFLELEQKYLRIVLDDEQKTKSFVKAIGAHKRDEFFMTDGDGTLINEAMVYQNLEES